MKNNLNISKKKKNNIYFKSKKKQTIIANIFARINVNFRKESKEKNAVVFSATLS